MQNDESLSLDIDSTAKDVATYIENDTFFHLFDDIETVTQILSRCTLNAEQASKIMLKSKEHFDEYSCYNIFRTINVDFNDNIVDMIKFIDYSNRTICANPLKSIKKLVDKINDFLFSTSNELDSLRRKVVEQENEIKTHQGDQAYTNKLEEIISLIKKKDFDSTLKFFFDNTIEPFSKDNSSFKIIKLACEAGLDEAYRNDQWKTPILSHFCINGNIKTVEYLIECGCNKDKTNAYQRNALTSTASTIHLDMLKYLISKGFDKDYRTKSGSNVIITASKNGRNKIIEYLISIGCSVNDVDSNKRSCIFWASFNGHLDAVKYLHSKGANPDAKDNNGQSSIHAAASKGHLEILKFLISIYCEKNDIDNNKNTCLHLAAENGHTDVVEYLISIRAKLSERNYYGQTPLYIARSKSNGSEKHAKIREILIAAGTN